MRSGMTTFLVHSPQPTRCRLWSPSWRTRAKICAGPLPASQPMWPSASGLWPCVLLWDLRMTHQIWISRWLLDFGGGFSFSVVHPLRPSLMIFLICWVHDLFPKKGTHGQTGGGVGPKKWPESFQIDMVWCWWWIVLSIWPCCLCHDFAQAVMFNFPDEKPTRNVESLGGTIPSI